jgi:multidrug resistance efflux pump
MARQQRDDQVSEDILLPTGWMNWTYALTSLLLLSGALFAIAVSDEGYSEGAAVIRADSRIPVVAPWAGIIETFHVQTAQDVAAGDPVLSISSRDDQTLAASVEHQIAIATRRLLSNPLDEAARSIIPSLQAELQVVMQRIDSKTLRSPIAGVIGDIRARAGQTVVPGENLLSLVQDDGRYHVVALLPAESAPRIRPGDTLQLQLRGDSSTYSEAQITAISEVALGPSEASRLLGRDISDAFQLTGAAIAVRGNLSTRHWEVSDQPLSYSDGMPAIGRVRIKSRHLISSAIARFRTAIRTRLAP